MTTEIDEFQDRTLDELLNDDEPAAKAPDPVPEAKEEPEAKPEVEAEPEVAEKQEDSDTGEKEEPSPGSDNQFNDREKALYKEAKAEREKRQELQRKLEASEANNSESGDGQPKGIDPLEDPSAYAEDLKFQVRAEISQNMMREKHDDYNEVELKFVEMVKANPSLGLQMRSHSSPAEFAYNTVKTQERFEQFGSFETALKTELDKKAADLEKTIREKVEKEYAEKFKTASSLPPSGAEAGSLGTDGSSIKERTTEDLFGT